MRNIRSDRDESLPVKPCRFYHKPDSGELATVHINPTNEEAPCIEIYNSILETLAMGLVGGTACLLQRECGVCPRGLGIEVDPSLIPLNKR